MSEEQQANEQANTQQLSTDLNDSQRSALLPLYPPAKRADLLHPTVMAYMGDAVFELLVRQYLISQPNHKPHHLHKEATRFVSAKAQKKLLDKWQPLLTEEEVEIVRRGRNAKSGSVPKNADVLEYRHATALEALIGYLYYQGQVQRLHELFAVALPKGK